MESNSIKMRNLIFYFGLYLMMISCNNSQITTQNNNFSILYQSEYGGEGIEKTIVYTRVEDFSNTWKSSIDLYSETSTLPKVDFTKKIVIAQHFDGRNSGGTQYRIQNVSQDQNKIKVYYKTTSSGEMATMAITSPLLIVAVDKVQNPEVEFILQN